MREQQGRINSYSKQKKPSHYTVFAVLILQKQDTFTYYSLVLFYFTSLYLSYKQSTSAKHNEGGRQHNARSEPSRDSALTVLPTAVTNQHLSLFLNPNSHRCDCSYCSTSMLKLDTPPVSVCLSQKWT